MKKTKFVKYIAMLCATVLMLSNTVVYAQSTSKEKVDLTIKTEQQLRNFFSDMAKGNAYAGKLIKLAKDIEVDSYSGNKWVLNSETNIAFEGTFDGAGHTISGINAGETSRTDQTAGLFGTIAKTGTVENLNIAESAFVSKDRSFAMIAGNNKGKISNCHIKSSRIYNEIWPGGIAVTNYGIIEDCTAEVDIDFCAYTAGGICNDNYGKIVNCAFGGSFKDYVFDKKANYYIAVTAGDIAASNVGMISNCFSYGKAVLTNEKSRHYAICGYTDPYKSTLKNCYYSEEISDGAYNSFQGTIVNVDNCTLEEMQTDRLVDKLNRTRGTSLAWHLGADSAYPVHVGVSEVRFKSLANKKGYIKSSKSYAADGETVKLTVKLNKGYKLKSISVKTTSGEKVALKKVKTGIYTFKMPDKDVVVATTVKQKGKK